MRHFGSLLLKIEILTHKSWLNKFAGVNCRSIDIKTISMEGGMKSCSPI